MRNNKEQQNKLKQSAKSQQVMTTAERERLYRELQGVETNAAVLGSFAGASALQKFVGGDDVHYWKLILSLDDQIKSVNNGDLKDIEGVLTAQIHILNSVFNNLAIRSKNQTNLAVIEQFMRLAFKAQNQCRVTVETLANLKNPAPSTLVKQTNIGYNQQVNNNLLPTGSDQ
jgi:hypothetical protein